MALTIKDSAPSVIVSNRHPATFVQVLTFISRMANRAQVDVVHQFNARIIMVARYTIVGIHVVTIPRQVFCRLDLERFFGRARSKQAGVS